MKSSDVDRYVGCMMATLVDRTTRRGVLLGLMDPHSIQPWVATPAYTMESLPGLNFAVHVLDFGKEVNVSRAVWRI